MSLSPYSYLDYRKYLKDAITAKREVGKFSLEQLSRKVGCLTKPHLSLIIAGKRNLTMERAAALAKALGLSSDEVKYFCLLVPFTQAKNAKERERHLTDLLFFLRRRSEPNLDLRSYQVLENWHCLVIRELARLPNFNPDPKIVSAQLKGLVSVRDAKLAIDASIATGLLSVDSDGQLRPSEGIVRTTDDISSLAIQNYHKSCLELGKKILATEPVAEREFGSLNILLRYSDKPKLKELLKTFREQVLMLAAEEGASDARVSQINFQMFDISQ